MVHALKKKKRVVSSAAWLGVPLAQRVIGVIQRPRAADQSGPTDSSPAGASLIKKHKKKHTNDPRSVIKNTHIQWHQSNPP